MKKNNWKSCNWRFEQADERVHEVDDQLTSDLGSKKRKEGMKWDTWDTIKYTSIYITGVPEGGERKKQKRLLEEMMAQEFPLWWTGNESN